MKLCNLDTAKALQELGYDGEYNQYVSDDGSYLSRGALSAYDWHIPAPRLDDAAYWLREKYDMGIYPYSVSQTSTSAYINGDYKLHQSRWMIRDAAELIHAVYHTYEDALEAAVTKAIEIIKNRQYDSDRT